MGSQDNLLRRSFEPGEFLNFWADVADIVGVCNFSSFRYLQLVNEKDGTGAGDVLAFRTGFFYSVGKKSTPYIGLRM